MELKPCPFCGGVARTGYAINDYNRWGVACKTCSATVEVAEWNGVEDTEENAIVAWNMRVAMNLPMEEWSNNACLGYVIKAMRNAGKSAKEIQAMVNDVRDEFDWTTVDEAKEIYNKSPY